MKTKPANKYFRKSDGWVVGDAVKCLSSDSEFVNYEIGKVYMLEDSIGYIDYLTLKGERYNGYGGSFVSVECQLQLDL